LKTPKEVQTLLTRKMEERKKKGGQSKEVATLEDLFTLMHARRPTRQGRQIEERSNPEIVKVKNRLKQ